MALPTGGIPDHRAWQVFVYFRPPGRPPVAGSGTKR
jgi:hypothetical protein